MNGIQNYPNQNLKILGTFPDAPGQQGAGVIKLHSGHQKKALTQRLPRPAIAMIHANLESQPLSPHSYFTASPSNCPALSQQNRIKSQCKDLGRDRDGALKRNALYGHFA